MVTDSLTDSPTDLLTYSEVSVSGVEWSGVEWSGVSEWVLT